MKPRPFVSDDLPYLLEMYRVLRVDEGQPDERSDAAICKQLLGLMQQDGYQCALSEDANGQLLGYVLYRESEAAVFLKHLFIQRTLRRQGHARRLLQFYIDGPWAGKSISLEVLAVNKAAIAFYQSMSFLLHSHLYTRWPL